MIYSVDLDEMAGKISHIDFIKYISDLQWKKYQGRVHENVAVYQKFIDDHFFQITVPCNRELRDYAYAMRKAIGVLSITESKSEEQLILELLNPISDILRVRHISSTVENGSILFEDAINLYENSKKLLTNAALDATNYKRLYKGRTCEYVQQFISKCRYGQTEIGSYVISLVCPFVKIEEDGTVQQLSIFSEESNCAHSITRKATKKIMDSISLIKTTIENGGNLSDLIEDETKHISVSFIESLSNLNISNENNGIEIKAKWAPTICDNISTVNQISLNHDYYSPLKSIVDKYREKDEQDSCTIEGKISLLQATPKIEERKTGIVKLAYISDDGKKTKKLQLVLDKDNYNIAISAHQAGKTVRAIGTLQGNKMTNVSLEIF